MTFATIEAVHEPSARSDAAYAKPVDTSPIANGASLPRGWRPTPGELVSLWDMLRVNAADFVMLMNSLDRVTIRMNDVHQTLLSEFGASPQAHSAHCEGLWESMSPLLDDIEQICGRMELKDPATMIGCIRLRCTGKPYGIPELGGSLRMLSDLITAQLNDRMFMFIPGERAGYLDNDHPFGEPVEAEFPELVEDISEASKSIGAGRYTAAVFHLMRVMELGVRRVAAVLSAAINVERAWGYILGDVHDAVRILPRGTSDEKERHKRLSEVAAHLQHVKDAWRNPTMHPKQTYTFEEAENLFKNVKVFIESLIGLR